MFRKLLRIHLWIGMALAVPLVLVCITGALLVFGQELQAEVAPEEWYADTVGVPLPFESLVARFEEQLPGVPINVIAMDQAQGHAWKFWLGNGEGVANVDPVSGTVLKHYQHNTTLYGYVLQLHRWLLIPEGDARSWARNLMSVIASVFILQLLMGLWMWMAPPRRLDRLKFSFRDSRRKIMSRLHSSTAMAASGVLILIAFTGIGFNWKNTVKGVVGFVTASEVREPDKLEAPGHEGVRNIDHAVKIALDTVGNGKLLSVNVPKSNNQPINVRIRPEDAFNAEIVTLDPVTAEVLKVRRVEDLTAAESFLGISYQLHIGDFAGLLVRWLWLLISLMPVFFVYSGIWIYFKRTKSKRLRAKEQKGMQQRSGVNDGRVSG